MLIAAFMYDDGEPCADVTEELKAIVKPEDCEPIDPNTEGRSLAELLADYNLEVSNIHAVSEPVATIALHALHGILAATDPNAPGGHTPQAAMARRWAFAALSELAFYDVDGLEVEPDERAMGEFNSYLACDPGREAVDKVRHGAHLTTGTNFYVPWPDPTPASRDQPTT